jgi:Tfp pilus assembly protein PilZ
MSIGNKTSEHLTVPVSPSASAASEQPVSLVRPVPPRYNCVGEADILLPGLGRSERGTIANLSATGCCVKSEFAFKVGQQVELMLQVNKMSFRVAGSVIHIPFLGATDKGKARAAGMGIEFKKMSAGARSRLQELITELNGR